MFNHVMLGVADMAASRRFYDATLAVLGARPGVEDPKGRVIYRHDGSALMLSWPIDGEPACGANGGTLGFRCTSAEQLQEWHKAGAAAGGKPIEDAPGPRPNGAHLAYLRDPAGNKLCAVFRP